MKTKTKLQRENSKQKRKIETKTKTKMPKQQNLSLNESASIQYGAYGCYGRTAFKSVTNGGRYLSRSSTPLRQQV